MASRIKTSPTANTPTTDDVAIIGMSGLFPGAPGLQAYWENIVGGVDAVSEPPQDWEKELFTPTNGHDGKIYCARGGYLGELAEFNPLEHGVMPSAIDGTEPDHFLALRLAQEALRDAGYADKDFSRQTTEVIIGRGTYVNRGNTTVIQHGLVVEQVLRVLKQLHPEHDDDDIDHIRDNLVASLPPFSAETAPGLVPNIISGRIANRLDLMGSNYVIDAACASSLVAVDSGRRDLITGRCDMAVVGGVNASTPPPILMIFCQLEAISRQGQIRPFDRRADGTLLGEGGGMIVLKRRDDAVRDGDRIYALIKDVGTASDGRAVGLLAPRLEGEELALRRAYDNAAVDSSTIGLIEAHGTGTTLGDAVELQALNNIFGQRRRSMPTCAIGTVKSMISHLLPASGIAGLIKTTLALHQRVLPPTLHCEEPNPDLGLDDSLFYINSVTRPWFQSNGEPRRAGVNAFGFGGINAHAILEEYKGEDESQVSSFHRNWGAELCIVCAADREKLRYKLQDLIQRLNQQTHIPLIDIAYTINQAPLDGERVSIVAESVQDLVEKLQLTIDMLEDTTTRKINKLSGIYYFSEPLGEQYGIALVFPGEGSQYPWMLKELCMHFPEVRASFELVDRAFNGHGRDVLPSEVIFPPSLSRKEEQKLAESRIWDMDFGAEAVFTANQALFSLLENLGIKANAMLGHSTGEHSALLASGTVLVDDENELIDHILGVNSVYEKLQKQTDIPEAVLVAVGGAEPDLIDSIIAQKKDLIEVAMDNCPHQLILSCAPHVADEVMDTLQKNFAICQVLPFRRAYHTPQFEIFSKPLRQYFDSLRIGFPRCDLYSCVSAARYPSDVDEIRSLAAIQWSSKVRFRETIELMYEQGNRIFLEVGPNNILSGFIADILRGKDYIAITSNIPNKSSITQLLHMAGQLVAHGVNVNLSHLFQRRSPRLVDLDAGQAEHKPNGNMRINLGLQPVRLPVDFSLPSRSNPQSIPFEAQPVTSMPTVMERNPALITNDLSTHTLSNPQDTGVRDSNVQQCLRDHFRTMEMFLQTEQAITNQFFDLRRGGTKKRSRPRTNGKAETTSMPFAGHIVEKIEGSRISLRRHICLEEDLLLKDHTLGREISAADPSLLALPVIPLTLSMEMLAQCASLLIPGLTLTGMKEIRGYRWITVEEHGVTLEIRGEIDPIQTKQVWTTMREVNTDGKLGPPLVEGMMVFDDEYPPAPGVPAPQFKQQRESTWKPERLYRDGMFHGPMFRAVTAINKTGDDGTLATLEVLPREGMFKSNSNPELVTDPVILDATGQVVAFWSQETLTSQYDIFPYRLKELQLFAAPQNPGTLLSCSVHARLFGNNQMTSDIDVTDEAGNLLYRLLGWEDRRFDLHENFIQLRNSPRDARIARQLHLNDDLAKQNVSLFLVDIFTSEFLEAHNAIWTKVLAYLVLGKREREQRNNLGQSEKYKRQWLLGRVCAKDAVRKLIDDKKQYAICPADIEISNLDSGSPEISIHDKTCKSDQFSVSISHSGDAAVALAVSGSKSLVGIDIESIRDHAESVSGLSFSQAEMPLLSRLKDADQTEWKLRFWCAKEAFAKALGKGLSIINDIEVIDMNLESGELTLNLGGNLAEEFPALTAITLVCQTSRDGNYVLAIYLKLEPESE